jgi:hypothetical protein
LSDAGHAALEFASQSVFAHRKDGFGEVPLLQRGVFAAEVSRGTVNGALLNGALLNGAMVIHSMVID